MAANKIDGGLFIPALRRTIKSLPFSDADHEILMSALNQCARTRHNQLEVIATRARGPAELVRKKLYMRAWRARQKAMQS